MTLEYSRFTAPGLAEGFVAGALSVLIFQMGAGAILYGLGLTPNAPYAMTPTAPFGVPQTLSGAFWGGLWGILLFAVLRRTGREWPYWLTAALFGALIVGGFLLFIVLPLKGRPLAAGWNPNAIALILGLHAVFALGAAVFIRLFEIARR